jgi:hypothetical protein
MGNLVLSGEGLHIVQLNLDEGLLVAEGLLHAFRYREGGVRARDAGKRSGPAFSGSAHAPFSFLGAGKSCL